METTPATMVGLHPARRMSLGRTRVTMLRWSARTTPCASAMSRTLLARQVVDAAPVHLATMEAVAKATRIAVVTALTTVMSVTMVTETVTTIRAVTTMLAARTTTSSQDHKWLVTHRT